MTRRDVRRGCDDGEASVSCTGNLDDFDGNTAFACKTRSPAATVSSAPLLARPAIPKTTVRKATADLCDNTCVSED